MKKKTLFLQDEEATLNFGGKIGNRLKAPLVVYLTGELGAGKTTFVRGLMGATRYHATIKSPTYTLLETYELDSFTLCHLDLYRLKDPRELTFLGLRDVTPRAVFFIEWPEKGAGHLFSPDIIFHFKILQNGREVTVEALSSNGEKLLF
jgi:tRNA threonylcarbamoyladenosine biosynthesis protein TsaE